MLSIRGGEGNVKKIEEVLAANGIEEISMTNGNIPSS